MPTSLKGDPLRLGQILVNLGNNAVKFTDQGEIIVGVEKLSETDDEVVLQFRVRDSGIGMTKEESARLFQSFSQADASTTRKYGGTGLGLAISKNLVEMMDGKIWVESEPNMGSTFYFNARFGLLPEQPLSSRAFAGDLHDVRLLLVDDNPAALEILASIACSFGMQVATAWDGMHALEMIRNNQPYDLVLMDWKMPVMDGIEVLRQLNEMPGIIPPPVIITTAYGRDELFKSAHNRGVTLQSVLAKPVTASSLLEGICELLGKKCTGEIYGNEKAEEHVCLTTALSGLRLLLAEDNLMNQELGVELLEQAGIEVVVANNGQEALAILASDDRFDGLLMDCQMPVMDGYTATRQIRMNPKWRNLPIIAMTANAMAGDREKVIEVGMNDHIAKPLNVSSMFKTLIKCLRPELNAATVSIMPEQSADPVLLASLPELPGVDVSAGITTSMNNLKLYTRLLGRFRDSAANFAGQFAAAQADAADPVAAERCAHTLKGNAGNIGARGVQAAAAALEVACRDGVGQPVTDELLAKTVQELSPVLEGLAALCPEESSAVETQTEANPVEIRELKERLKDLLQASSAKAGPLASELSGLLQGTAQAEAMRQVAAATADYDFDAALEALEKISEEED